MGAQHRAGLPVLTWRTRRRAAPERITDYAAHYEYLPALPTERLTEEELQQWERIQEDLARLRADVDRFIELHRERRAT
jgi:hypothetical protein